jgi:tRNA threonylcarbamoyladenosine biosynthesis protein TsaB
MIVLGLDTATSTAGIALVDNVRERVLGQARHGTSGRGADLLVAIDDMCRVAGIAPQQIDAIAVGAGPGSFTGLRIGMATAKGIAFAANRPLWAVSSLAALADDALRELAEQQLFTYANERSESAGGGDPAGKAGGAGGDVPRGIDGVICAVLDARRGEVFAGCFRHGAALAPERVMPPAEVIPWAAQLTESARTAASAQDRPTLSFAGDAIDAHRDVFAPLEASGDWLAARTPSGHAVAKLALAGTRVDITRSGAPTYIRPSEAEVMYPDGVPGALRRR